MVKKVLWAVAIGAVLLCVIGTAVRIGWSVYITEYRLTDTAVSVSPDGRYTAVLQMVGEPDWPFGPTSVRVTVRQTAGGEILEQVDTAIRDDGANLSPGHWTVVWKNHTVEITLHGSEQADAVYTVDLPE